MRSELGREVFRLGGQQMVRYEVRHLLEPEVGDLIEDLALARDARLKDVVVGGDTIAGDDQKGVAEIIDITDFTALGRRQPVELGLP